MATRENPLLVVTGGGTGGHLYPALAVVEAVQALKPDQEILYIGREAERDRSEVEKRGIPFMGLPLMGLRRKLTIKNIRALALFISGIAKSRSRMKMNRSGVVFGVGGYVSAPAMTAGKLLGWRVCLHEQNTVPGLVNRVLARRCDRVYLTFDRSREYLKGINAETTGFPLRRDLVASAAGQRAKKKDAPLSVLVIGGSQGAKRLVEVAAEAFWELNERSIPFRATVQTGANNFEWAKGLDWREEVELLPYINDMASAYSSADVVVSRAGSGSLSEIALWGLPAVLVPYPYASANHQEINAQSWVEEGAAIVLREREITGNLLCGVLANLLTNEEKRTEMHGRSSSLSRSDAAGKIAQELIALLGQES